MPVGQVVRRLLAQGLAAQSSVKYSLARLSPHKRVVYEQHSLVTSLTTMNKEWPDSLLTFMQSYSDGDSSVQCGLYSLSSSSLGNIQLLYNNLFDTGLRV